MSQTHTFLVAVNIEGDINRAQAENGLMRMMPRPGQTAWVPNDPESALSTVECWWIAEDDRTDRSDNDSAVFVTPGFQKAAYDLLHDRELTPDCNDPERGGRTLDAIWEPPGDGRGLYVTEVPDDIRLPHPDVPCRWCGEFSMDENACPNAKDICNDCCGED